MGAVTLANPTVWLKSLSWRSVWSFKSNTPVCDLESESESCSVVSKSLWPHGLYSPWNSSGQNTGVGSLSLLQGIFPTQGSNPGLSHCGQILYQLSHNRRPRILEWVAYPFSRGPSRSRNRTRVSCISGRFFANWAIREACMWSWLTSFTSLDLEQVHPWNGAIHAFLSLSYCLSRRGYLAGERMECFARRIMSLN